MLKKLDFLEDPISEVLKFSNFNVGIDNNVPDGKVETFPYDMYLAMCDEAGIDIVYGRDIITELDEEIKNEDK